MSGNHDMEVRRRRVQIQFVHVVQHVEEHAIDFHDLGLGKALYEGPFTAEFIAGVRQGRYPVREGVVAKGIALGKKQDPQHGLWMAKVKTRWWLEELKGRTVESDVFRQALEENLREQGCEAA